MTKIILSGYAAIEYAERHDLPLSKYTDPTEDARDDLSVDEAREIAREDCGLIWIEATLTVGSRVEAGQGEDHDTGRIIEIDGEMALVAWDSGVKTRHPLADLTLEG